MDEDPGTTTPVGITRRNLIKGAAVVGGTVWVAPVIDSFVTRAAATSGNCTGCTPTATPIGCFGNSTCICALHYGGSCVCVSDTGYPVTCASDADCAPYGAYNICLKIAGYTYCGTPCTSSGSSAARAPYRSGLVSITAPGK